MSFLVEDGSGKKGATSYATIAEFKSYFTDRGSAAAVALTDPVIQAGLIAGTDYIDTRWGLKLRGTRRFTTLTSRSAFTLSAQPSDGDTVTVGSAIATFKTTATLDTHAEIGDILYDTLSNLATALAAASAAAADGKVADFLFPNPDLATLVIYTDNDGVATTTTAGNGSFDVATSTGWSLNQQPLQFPRSNLRDSTGLLITGMPDPLKEATFEYAYRSTIADLAPDPTVDASGGKVTGSRKKVGPIETETTFSADANIAITKPYPAADRLLQEYVKGSNGVVRA